MANPFKSYLFLSVLFFLLLQSGQAQNDCQRSRCGKNGPEIRFPFRVKGLQQPQCGFPGFELSCRGQETVIELPVPQKFHVKSIDYASKTIELYDPNNCHFGQYLKIEGRSLSPFGFRRNYLSNYTMFNCSEADRGQWDSVSCISQPGFKVLVIDHVFQIAQLPLAYCTKIRDMFGVPFDMVSGGSFALNWTLPDCSSCEMKRLGCRLKNGTTRGETECFAYPKSNKGKIRTIVATVATLGTAILTVILVFAYRAYSSDKQEKENQRE